MANGVPSIKGQQHLDELKQAKQSDLIDQSLNNLNLNETIDFLNFIRYVTIIYKSDITNRLKFLFAICMKDKENMIKIYNEIFKQKQAKKESDTNSNTKNMKTSMPIMNQDEFIRFWGLINNLFNDVDKENELHDASITISTLLFKLGEATRKLKVNETQQSQTTTENEPLLVDKIEWCITFEQIIASVLNDNLFCEYFDRNFDLDAKLNEYKLQHA